jgi:hypothetical protein
MAKTDHERDAAGARSRLLNHSECLIEGEKAFGGNLLQLVQFAVLRVPNSPGGKIDICINPADTVLNHRKSEITSH